METYLSHLSNYLLTQSWQIAVLVVVIAIVSLALRNRSAHVRYLLWLLVLAKCLVPPLLTIPLAVLPPEGPVTAFEQPVVTTTESTVPSPASVPEPPVQRPAEQVIKEKPVRLVARQWLGLTWIAGVMVFVLVAVTKALRTEFWLRRQRKPLPAELQIGIEGLFSDLRLRSFPKVWLVKSISQPFVWGLLRGGIYLPDGFVKMDNTELRKGVLGHELSHILRFDAAVNLLQVVAQAIFWFNPFVWWANKRIRAEREKCCDEMAIARLKTQVGDYSRAIVETLVTEYESKRPVPSLAVAGPVKNIEERIKTMLRPGKKFYRRPSLVTATIILLLAILTVPTALVLTARAEEKSSIQKEKAANSLAKTTEDEKLERIKKYIARVDDINAGDTWGYTFLHQACMEGEKQVAELLIAKGADVNARNIVGITPLHAAAGRGHRDIVELLLNSKADVNARDDHDATPLWYAKNGVAYSFDVFGRFRANATARWNPENPGCKEVVELLVERGAIERVPTISLHEAAIAGLMEKVKSLVVEGADVNAMDDRLAGTPLHLAAYGGQKEVIEFLIAKGADVNARNKWDRTPLHIALDQGHTEIAELLRKHGARLEPATETARIRVTTSLFEFATSKYAIPERNLEIPEQMQACAANLRKIHEAIKKYEKDKGQLPAWLSDLVPNYVSKEMLMCPNNPETEWKRHAADPKLPCGYTYEFCPTRAFARFGGAPTDGMTMRDRKMAQVAFFGDTVPLCRCRLHGPTHGPKNLNISVGGEVYLSGPQWESLIIPDYKVGSELSVK
jgi:beta-lactamase regulating signal transducer with metallopeptidase domain/ankyrin repeat protein